jgi:hypothetical protein
MAICFTLNPIGTRLQRTYILRTGEKIRTMRLDRNDGAARRVAPEQGPDPKLESASFVGRTNN